METFSIASEITDPYPKKRSRPKRIPWLAFISLLSVILCMGASAAVIFISDNQTVTSWVIQPAVQLAIFAALSNVALGVAFSEAVVSTWWTSAANGASLKELHYIWDRGEGLSFFTAVAAGPATRKVARTMLAVIIVKVATGPLLQRATRQEIEIVTGEIIKLNIAQRLRPGWTGRVTSPTTIRGSRDGIRITADWWHRAAISTPDTYCDGTCEGIVPGAGIGYTCSSTTRALDLRAGVGAVLFEINSTMSQHSPGGTPFLRLTTLYSTAIDKNCIANLTTDTCEIVAGIVEYPVILRNSTIRLNTMDDIRVHSPYTYSEDLPTAAEGSPAGTLRGLAHFANNFDIRTPSTAPNRYSGSLMANLFFQTDSSHYDNYAYANCGLQWSSPTDFILNSIHDFMFRAALRAANDTASQAFVVTKRALVFHSVYGYLSAASIITLFAVSLILLRLKGWWSIKRIVSLSPLETAKAFCAPLMEHGRNANITASGIVKDIGQIRVKYVDGVMAVNDNGTSSTVELLLTPDHT